MADLLLTGGVQVTVTQDEVNAPDNFAGVYFDIIQDHTVNVQNQITDNYIESNTAIHDHIAHAPITLSLRGLSAEIIYTPPTKTINFAYKGVNKFIGNNITHSVPQKGLYTDKLIGISALYPPVDNVTQAAKNAVQYIEASVGRYTKIVNNLRGRNRDNRLQKIYSDLIDLRNTNTALIVETPYAVYENMYIQSISFKQGGLNYITDLELTLKQVKFANIETTKANEKVLSKYNQWARAQVENHGNVQGKSVDNATLLKGWANKGGLTEAGSGIKR